MGLRGPYRHANGPTRTFATLRVQTPYISNTGRSRVRQSKIPLMMEGEIAVDFAANARPGDKIIVHGGLYLYVPINKGSRTAKDMLTVKLDRWEFVRDNRYCES